jgi:hypothetical protein
MLLSSHLTRCLAVAAFLLTVPRLAAESDVGWDCVPDILARIKPPQFAERDFDLTDFDAVADGRTDCKSAIDKAIAACAASIYISKRPPPCDSAPIPTIICRPCSPALKATS